MVVAVRLLQADDDLVKLLSLLRQWQLRPQKIDQFARNSDFSCLKSNIIHFISKIIILFQITIMLLLLPFCDHLEISPS